ncbi:outer membrane beta-barrel protein [Sphingomonas sp. Leaf343]|uniref:outer membrane beta-barrel protein n=1 Tax=Sphingomonas sp. Leaf343 TaxID=1736345 RepID=UPI0006FBFDC6|nr:outer membrane beta-barrel protein [Sphingomonas sp. Leaf343]KQR88059.1 hypothetical protein ASG07_04245 [Sphingomonas sp. Leaf343]
MNTTGRTMIALSAMMGATSAYAQTAAPERHLTAGVRATATYDSNISRTSDELRVRRGLTKEDMRYTPSLTIDALLPLGRQSLSLIGAVGYDFYQNNTRLNSERVNLDGAAGFQVSQCSGAFTANYARRQSDLGDLFFITDPVGTISSRVRNQEDIKSIGVSAACGGAIGIKPTASIQQTWVDNSAGIRRISDYSSTSAQAGLSYSRPTFGLLTLFGSYSTTSFPNRSSIVGLPDSDGFKSKGGGIRFERAIGSRLSGLVEVSYTSTDSQRSVNDFSGITYRGQITQRIGTSLLWTFDVSRAVQPSNRVDANYSVEELYSFNADYALSERAGINLNLYSRDRNYRGGFLVLGPSLVNDQTRSVTVGGRYRLLRRINLTLAGTRESRQANGTIFDYKSTRVVTGISTTF